MNTTTFFLLQCKRVCKTKAFLFLLLLFPVCLFLLSSTFRTKEDARIQVGICLATNDELTKTLYDKLLGLEDSLFSFYEVPSEAELLRLVQSNRFECGYLFHKPLGKELAKSHLKNLITIYVSETTTCNGVLNELVYANLFEEYALSLLEDHLTEAAQLPFSTEASDSFSLPPVTSNTIEKRYRSHLSDGSTFRFDVQFLSADSISPKEGTTAATLPLLRGLASIFLLLCGFCAALTVHHDRKNGLYARLRGKTGVVFAPLTIVSHLLPSAFSCLLGLGISGCITAPLREIAAMFCYCLVLLLFYLLLETLLQNHTMLCAAFPMVLLCTLVFTPVITDFSVFFPWIRVVRYALPTYYYFLFF